MSEDFFKIAFEGEFTFLHQVSVSEYSEIFSEDHRGFGRLQNSESSRTLQKNFFLIF